MKSYGFELSLFALGFSLVLFPLTAYGQCETERLLPYYPQVGAHAGRSVVLVGDVAAVGAPEYDVNEPPIVDAGAVFVYRRGGSGWNLEEMLISPNPQVDAKFGSAVTIVGDRLVVGSPGAARNPEQPNEGAVHTFRYAQGDWTEDQAIFASNGNAHDSFGAALANDGAFVVVGAPDKERAYLFERTGEVLQERQILVPSQGGLAHFGAAVAIEGNKIAVGAPLLRTGASHGGAYVFTEAAGAYSETAQILPENRTSGTAFGEAVALDGSRLFIGAPGDDSGANNSGAVHLYTLLAGTWTEQQVLLPATPRIGLEMGTALAVADDYAVVGSEYSTNAPGLAFVFHQKGGAWQATAELRASYGSNGDEFGWSVALEGTTALVGAGMYDAVRDGATMFPNAGFAAVVNIANPRSCPGDMDCDGALNNFDIDPFVLALSDAASYAQVYPECFRDLADIDGDGGVNNFDIDPFVGLLSS